MGDKEGRYWIINKKVYDLEPYFNKHPGGSYILKMNRGRDCTELFYSYHMLTKKKHDQMMKPYYVRDAEPQECASKFNWDEKPLYEDLRNRLREWKKADPNRGYKATTGALINYALIFLMGIYAYFFWFIGSWWTLPFIAFWGYYGSGEILHSATHFSVFKKSKWNEWAGTLGFYHSLPLSWYHQHVIAHHGHTNVQGYDPDLDHFRGYRGLRLGWRTNTNQNWYKDYKKWRNIVAVFAPLASWGPLILRPIDILRTGTYMKVLEFKFTSNGEKFRYIASLILWLLLPPFMMWNLGIVKGILFCAIPRIMHGINYYCYSQVNHITGDAFKYVSNPELYKEANPGNEWLVHQIITTVDYSTQSPITSYLATGLNNQAIHHVCPSIHPSRFSELNLLLRQFCNDHNIPYTAYDSYSEALQKHFQYLASMNDVGKVKKTE